MKKQYRLFKSFKHALEGILWVYKEHPNFRIHAVVSIFVLGLGFILRFGIIEYAILILTILLVYIAEMLNTAVEEVTNLITVKWAKQAKIAKDVSAGMVLVGAIGSVIIGLLLFIPKIYPVVITIISYFNLP